MKKYTLSLATLALGLTLITPVLAQGVTGYDPVMEKRPFLHQQYRDWVRKGAKQSVRMHRTAADVKGLDTSRRVDFFSLANKRGELRARINAVGFDEAYAEWMHQREGR